jgi:hypothetical protein
MRRLGDESQEQILEALKQRGDHQRKKWERGLLTMVVGSVLFVLVREICFRDKAPGDWFWYLFGVVIDLPLLYFGGRVAGRHLGYGRPTSFDKEVLDLLIVRDEDTLAIWKAVYGSLHRSSHPVFRDYVVRELSAGRALPGSEEELGDLFVRELLAARRREEMPDNYLRLIADYLRRHGEEERLNEITHDYFAPRPDDPVRCAIRAALLPQESGSEGNLD